MARHYNNFALITQNVDGLHQVAGSKGVIEIHGNIRRIRCAQCGHIAPQWVESAVPPPRCPRPGCNGKLRPDVVWFGEPLPADALRKALAASEECDLFFSIGTSAIVQPAASFPLIALEHRAIIIEINLRATPLTRQLFAHSNNFTPQQAEEIVSAQRPPAMLGFQFGKRPVGFFLRGHAGEVLPRLIKALWQSPAS